MSQITFDAFHAPERPTLPAFAKRKGWRALALSVLIHLSIIAIAGWLAVNKNTTPVAVPPPAIEARLIPFIAPPKPAEPVSVSPQLEQDIEEQHTQLAPADSTKPEANAEPEVNNPEPAQEAVNSEPPSQPQTVTAAPVVTEQQPTSTLSSRERLDRFFSAQRQLQMEETAQQAAKTFREQKTSPVIVDSRKNNPKPIQDGPAPKRVNCSSTVNKSVALLGSLFGGNMKCTEPPDFEGFIEARKNGTHK